MMLLAGGVALLSAQSCTQNPEKATVPKDVLGKQPSPPPGPQRPPEPPPQPKADYPPPAT